MLKYLWSVVLKVVLSFSFYLQNVILHSLQNIETRPRQNYWYLESWTLARDQISLVTVNCRLDRSHQPRVSSSLCSSSLKSSRNLLILALNCHQFSEDHFADKFYLITVLLSIIIWTLKARERSAVVAVL